jgi:hypothetical protein
MGMRTGLELWGCKGVARRAQASTTALGCGYCEAEALRVVEIVHKLRSKRKPTYRMLASAWVSEVQVDRFVCSIRNEESPEESHRRRRHAVAEAATEATSEMGGEQHGFQLS